MNAIILAGGKSTRFGGDKTLSTIRGVPLILKIVSNLEDVFKKIYVVGNKSKYSFLKNIEVIEDIIPDKGPLMGLYTGLKYSTSQYNCVIGSDMPLLTSDYFRFLITYEGEYDVLVPENNNYIEPLAGIYSKNCLKSIYRAIKHEKLKIKSFYPQVKVEVISEEIIKEIGEPASLFYNINYKMDLEKLRDLAR